MSVRSMPAYQVVCDFPGCTACAQDEGEYNAWAEPATAVDEASDAGWWIGVRGSYHYCTGHPGVWEADLADDLETEPDKPYLLHREDGTTALVKETGDV